MEESKEPRSHSDFMLDELQREQMLKSLSDWAYEKIQEALESLRQSCIVSFTRKYVKLNWYCGFSVECERSYSDGKPYYFQIYYQEADLDVDCCTLYGLNDDQDIRDFIKMWVK